MEGKSLQECRWKRDEEKLEREREEGKVLVYEEVFWCRLHRLMIQFHNDCISTIGAVRDVRKVIY